MSRRHAAQQQYKGATEALVMKEVCKCRAPRPPREENVLYLNGDSSGVVNNVCFPSTVAPSYAPPGEVRVQLRVMQPLPISKASARLPEPPKDHAALMPSLARQGFHHTDMTEETHQWALLVFHTVSISLCVAAAMCHTCSQ